MSQGEAPCQDSDLGSTDGVLPGFDPSFTSLYQPCLAGFQEGFESFDVGRHDRAYRVEAFLQLVSVRWALLLRGGAGGGGGGGGGQVVRYARARG